eukprot:2899238-Amphidinium_carterae.2
MPPASSHYQSVRAGQTRPCASASKNLYSFKPSARLQHIQSNRLHVIKLNWHTVLTMPYRPATC